MRLVQRYSAAHGVRLALDPLRIDTGARPHPVLRLTTEQAVADGRGDRRVADSHLADAKDVAALGRLHAIGHGGGAFGLVEGSVLGDVAGRLLEGELEHLEAEVEALADLVHGSTVMLEIGHHLHGHFLRIGSNALRNDTMVSGKNRNDDTLRFRRMLGLPGAQPFTQAFKPSEGAGRLGQLAFARATCSDGIKVGTGNFLYQFAYIVEGQSRGCICHLR